MLRFLLGSIRISLYSFIIAVSFSANVQAQEATKLTISPPIFELAGNPGDTLSNQVKVTNTTDSVLDLETRVDNIAGTNDQGQVQLTEEATTFALSNWVASSPNSFSLAPKETKVVTFTITIPRNAEPGGHYGSLLVGTKSGVVGETGAAVVQRIGTLLLVKVSGQAKEIGSVRKFVVKSFIGDWEEVTATDTKIKSLQAKNENTALEKVRHYFPTGPLAFDLTIKNSGNVHFKPAGYVAVYNMFHQKVAELPLNSANVFPGGERRMTVIWPQKTYWGLYYQANFVGLYGNQNLPLSGTTTFWAFPLPALIAIGLLLLLIIIGHHRLRRVVQVLFTGNVEEEKTD